MNRAQFQIQNSAVIKLLQDYAEAIKGVNNVVLGSVSLIAHTQSNHYYRDIKDVDALVNLADKTLVEARLLELGYKKSSFIPVIGWLFSRNVRFTKGDSPDLDISYVDFVETDESITLKKSFISVILPPRAITTTEFFTVIFNTFSIEATKLSKEILNRTIGRIILKGVRKRTTDMQRINELIDGSTYNNLIEAVKIKIGSTVIKLPRFLYK